MSGINPYTSLFFQVSNLGIGQNLYAPQQAEIVKTPTDLQRLATSIILKGEIISKPNNGQTIISTNRGDVAVRLKTQYPIGAKVELQIDSGGKQATIQPSLTQAIAAKITTDGTQSPLSTQPQTAPTSVIADVKNLQATTQLAIQNPTGAPPLLIEGQAVRITTLPAAQQNLIALQNFTPTTPTAVKPTLLTTLTPTVNATTLAISPPPNGTSVHTPPNTTLSTATKGVVGRLQSTPQTLSTSSLQIVGSAPQVNIINKIPLVTLSPIRPNFAPPLTFNNSAALLTPPSDNIAITTTLSSARNLPLNQTSDLRVTTLNQSSIKIQGSPPANSPLNFQMPSPLLSSSLSAGQTYAIATGFMTANGNPIVQLPSVPGQMRLASINYPASNLPAGTQISFAPIAGGWRSSFNQTTSPSSLQNMIKEMGQLLPATQMQKMMDILPSVTQSKQFPAAAILFLAAARGGDLSAWIGQKNYKLIDTHSSTSKKMLQTLMSDITNNTAKSATITDPAIVQTSQDWRGYMIPLLFGTNIHEATLWTKYRQDDDNNSPEKSTGTRFIMDVKLSRMGDILLDGYIHKDKKIFELSVVTQQPIRDAMQNQLKSLWFKTLQGIDLNGNIAFKEAS